MAKENKGNSKNRYRLNNFTALKLGLTTNKSGRYRLNDKQKKQLFELDQQKIKRLLICS